MTPGQKIRLAAEQGRDPDAVPIPNKILLAAAHGRDPDGVPILNKIRLAAGPPIDEAAAAAKAYRKIRAAAGLPVDDAESMAKALAMSRDIEALDGLVADLGRSLKPSPPARRMPRPTPVRPTLRRGRVAEPAPLPPDHPLAYWNFRDRLAGDIRTGHVHPTTEHIARHAVTGYGISAAEAAYWTERFLGHVRRALPVAIWPGGCSDPR